MIDSLVGHLVSQINYGDPGVETEPGHSEQTETKPTETKPTETKPTETKPTETKPQRLSPRGRHFRT